MREVLVDWLPWVLSATTIWSMLLAGSVRTLAWTVGLWNQVLWFVWILAGATWGLLPMNVALAIVYVRNRRAWRARERREQFVLQYLQKIQKYGYSNRRLRGD